MEETSCALEGAASLHFSDQERLNYALIEHPEVAFQHAERSIYLLDGSMIVNLGVGQPEHSEFKSTVGLHEAAFGGAGRTRGNGKDFSPELMSDMTGELID